MKKSKKQMTMTTADICAVYANWPARAEAQIAALDAARGTAPALLAVLNGPKSKPTARAGK